MVRSFAAHECCSSALKSQEGPAHACKEMLERMMSQANFGGTHDAGVLLLQGGRIQDGDKYHLATVEVTAAYTAPSFGVGYYGSCMDQPKTSILRRSQETKTRKSCVDTIMPLRDVNVMVAYKIGRKMMGNYTVLRG